MNEQNWAPLVLTFAGIWEIDPAWVEENASSVQVVDVREENEFTGPLGHIEAATLIPLGELQARMSEIDKTKPVVAVCRSGARSGQATNMLKAAGFEKVANLSGGMLRWRAEGRAVDGGNN